MHAVDRRGVPGLSRYTQEIVARGDVGYFIHTAVVGRNCLTLPGGPNPIDVLILIKVHLRVADRLAGFIAHRAIEDRLGHQVKKQVFGV